MEIRLKKDNVVKKVDSEDRAKIWEQKGFVRIQEAKLKKTGTDGKDKGEHS